MTALPQELTSHVPESAAQPAPMRHGAAFLGFVLLACLFTFPAVLRLGSHILGMDDAHYFVWELWWFHRAVFELHTDPLHTNLLFYPTPSVPLIWSTPVNLLPGMALVGLVGPVAAYNLLVLSGLVLAGYGAYRLAYRFVKRRDAAFLAGLIFAFAPAHMAQVMDGHLGVLTIQWVPFSLLALLRLHDRLSWSRAAVFALTLALVLGSDLYVAIYFLGTLGLAGAVWALKHRPAPRFLAWAGGATMAAVLAVLPFHLPTWRNLQGATTNAEQGLTVHQFGQDVVQLLLPAPFHPLFGRVSWPLYGHITNRDAWGTLGLTVLVLAALALWKRRDALTRFWAWVSGIALVGSLGTYLNVAGPTRVPLPYLLVTYVPVIKSLRVPDRLAEVTALGLAMLAAAGSAWWLTRLGRRALWVFAGLLAAIGLEYLVHAPFPTTSAAVPGFYQALATNPAAGALLEIPNGDANWGGPTHTWMYYQTVHHRPLVVGHTHRIPNGALDYIYHTPIVDTLAHVGWGGLPPELRGPAGRAGFQRLADDGITHIVVHEIPGVFAGAGYQRLVADLTRLLGAPVYQEPGMAAFLTPAPHVRLGHGR